MALGDFQQFNGSAYNAFKNTLQQEVNLFNGATRNAITLASVMFSGDKNELTAFESIASLVGNRDPGATGANTEHALSELLKIDIKVGWGIPKISYTNAAFDWTQRDPAIAGTLFGEEVAKGAMAYMLNSALASFVGAVDGDDVTYDGTAGVADLSALNLGAGKFGDRQSDIACWVMHSKSVTDIYGQALANAAQLFEFGTVRVVQDGHGRPLVMTDSDSLHFDNSGTENYFQCGIVAGGVSVQEQGDYRNYTVTDIDPINPKELLTATGSFALGLKGYTFKDGVVRPTNANLSDPANWTMVGGLKDSAGVRVTTL